MELYLSEVNNIPMISREEENRLAFLAREGDTAARNRLIQSHLRFVIRVAKRYSSSQVPLEDLIAEGNIGLLQAIAHYDVSRGIHFISYAVWWIRQAIMKAIAEQSNSIRLPMNRTNQLMKIERMGWEMRQNSGRELEFEEIVDVLKLPMGETQELMNIARGTVSLDREHQAHNGREGKLEDQIVSSQRPPEEQAILSIVKEDINRALGILSPKEADILQSRFGLNGRKPLSLSKIASRYELTKERVRQLEKQALQTLLNSPRTRHLEAYLAS